MNSTSIQHDIPHLKKVDAALKRYSQNLEELVEEKRSKQKFSARVGVGENK